MGLVSPPPQLSLDLKPPCDFSPVSVSRWLRVVSTISDDSERLSKVDEFIGRLETELVKIQVFQRELPLCVLLLNDAITVLKEESKEYTTWNTKPVLKEFIPSKEKSSEEPRNDANEDLRDKGNWLSSVQLWSVDGVSSHNHTQNQTQKQRHNFVSEPEKVENRWKKIAVSHDLDQLYEKRPCVVAPISGCHLSPMSVNKIDLKGDLAISGLSLCKPDIENPKEIVLNESNLGLRSGVTSTLASTVQKNHLLVQHQLQPANRKQRRCWSHELHRRFVNALQRLGGAHVATPKQIREIMQVDGLTNDEVKSHLQKYRLHTKRGCTRNESVNTSNSQHLKHSNPSKPSSPRSGSPQSPFQFSLATGGTSTTAGDSIEEEENSEGHINPFYR